MPGVFMLRVMMLGISHYADCCYAECQCSKSYYAKRHSPECRGALTLPQAPISNLK